MSTKIASGDVLEMLRRHYLPEGKPPAGIFAPEIAAPRSSGRADLIWQGCTAAGGHELVGHEVKVTRADLLTELADLTKSDPWQRYCDRWWLVVPDAAIVEGLELPVTWGVYTPPSGRRTRSMTVHAPAPKLLPQDQADALRTLATRLHWQAHNAEQLRVRAVESRDRAQRRADEADARTPQQSPRQDELDDLVRKIVTGIGSGGGRQRVGRYPGVTVEDIVSVLRDGVMPVREQLDLQRMRLAAEARRLKQCISAIEQVDLGRVEKALLNLEEHEDMPS